MSRRGWPGPVIRRALAAGLLAASLLAGAAGAAEPSGPRLADLFASHRTFFAGRKDPARAPLPLTDDGRFKATGQGDLFSRAMDAWGSRLLAATTAAEALAVLDAVAAWGAAVEAEANRLAIMLDRLRNAGTTGGGGAGMPGEFAAAAAGPAEYGGIIDRLADLDRWMALDARLTLQHAGLIRTYAAEFSASWSDLRIHGAVFGTSLVQRLYDAAEIQTLFEDMLVLAPQEEVFLARYAAGPFTLGPGARFIYAELSAALPEAARPALAELAGRPYAIGFLNAQFRRYHRAPAGGRFAAARIAAAAAAYTARQGPPPAAALMELIDFRQGELYCGYRPDSRFAPELAAMGAGDAAATVTDAAAAAITALSRYFAAHWTYGASTDIADAFVRRRADCFRMANLGGVLLANAGFTGIHPMRTANHAFLALDCGGRFVTCDPYGDIPPGKLFPDDFAGRGDRNVTLFARTIGGGVAWQTLVRPGEPAVVLSLPWLPPPAPVPAPPTP
ncbi:MAG: hypothetical protein ABIF71_13100 [Planctomycetota bacterium]